MADGDRRDHLRLTQQQVVEIASRAGVDALYAVEKLQPIGMRDHDRFKRFEAALTRAVADVLTEECDEIVCPAPEPIRRDLERQAALEAAA
jgi:hypothetical protein